MGHVCRSVYKYIYSVISTVKKLQNYSHRWSAVKVPTHSVTAPLKLDAPAALVLLDNAIASIRPSKTQDSPSLVLVENALKMVALVRAQRVFGTVKSTSLTIVNQITFIYQLFNPRVCSA